MKSLLIIFLFGSLQLSAQDKLVGRYRDYFGSRLLINSDHTFKYTWNFDMAASWTKGIWTVTGDTIYFHMIPTYDTLSYVKNNMAADSLILSIDEISERITPMESVVKYLSSGGQNMNDYPDKLLFRKGRLYKIKNGKLVKKKVKGFWNKKKFIPWYFKSED